MAENGEKQLSSFRQFIQLSEQLKGNILLLKWCNGATVYQPYHRQEWPHKGLHSYLTNGFSCRHWPHYFLKKHTKSTFSSQLISATTQKITQEKRLCFPPSLLKTFISHRIPIHHESTKQQAFDISLSKISEGNCSHSPWIKHLKFYIINILIYTTEFYQMSICSFGEEKLLEQKFLWALINIL